MKQWQIILTLLLVNNVLGFSQSQREVYNASTKAYENKDYEVFLKLTQKLDSMRPFHPTYTYNLASAYALNGKTAMALSTLRKLVLMNNTTPFETDDDFKALQGTEGFNAILALKKDQNKLVASSKQVVTLSEKDLHPEGLIYLPKTKTWLASSIRKGKIVSFDIKTGQSSDWLKEDKMLAVLAMKADAKFLWVTTSAFQETAHFVKEDEGKAEVLKVDIKTRKIIKRFSVDGNHVFGDLVVGKNGIVYVSDSGKPMVYKIQNDLISEFASFEKDGFNLQGLAFNKEQSKLFVADYLKGIAVIDMQSMSKTWLSFPEGASAKGIDGLVFYDNTLVAIQNGVKPIRIMQFRLNEQQHQFSGFKVLDNNRPEFNEPALATVVGGMLYFFANSPWNAYDKMGDLDTTKVSNPMVFSCKLD
ncbi:MAG: hypothetical protein M0D53_14970 [Flavobacterium sp. JAD_PAG50586_2]|nr:MAG: hypothetical protein M0D53_14970 [Flavobacterium sp. JAD_PAG50586_2]